MKKTRKNAVANEHGREIESLRSRYSLGPLEHMMKIINDDKLPLELRSYMAAAALPFMHHKLKPITIDDVDLPDLPAKANLDLSKLTAEERQQLERILVKSKTRR